MKLYSRVGSTCLINLKKNYIEVYKKWSNKPGLWITLWKQDKQWILKINQNTIYVSCFK